jgi:hypothetical protein
MIFLKGLTKNAIMVFDVGEENDENPYRQLKVGNAMETAAKIRKMVRERLAHPPYALDLSPCHGWCLRRPKAALRNRRSVDLDDAVDALTNPFGSVTFDKIHRVFQSWIR